MCVCTQNSNGSQSVDKQRRGSSTKLGSEATFGMNTLTSQKNAHFEQFLTRTTVCGFAMASRVSGIVRSADGAVQASEIPQWFSSNLI
jgi:hypothetical protein